MGQTNSLKKSSGPFGSSHFGLNCKLFRFLQRQGDFEYKHDFTLSYNHCHLLYKFIINFPWSEDVCIQGSIKFKGFKVMEGGKLGVGVWNEHFLGKGAGRFFSPRLFLKGGSLFSLPKWASQTATS